MLVSFFWTLLLLPTSAPAIDVPTATPEPELFAPGVVSKPDCHEFGIVVTADGSEVFFGVDVGDRSEIWHVAKDGDGWGPDRPLLRDDVVSFNDPALDQRSGASTSSLPSHPLERPTGHPPTPTSGTSNGASTAGRIRSMPGR